MPDFSGLYIAVTSPFRLQFRLLDGPNIPKFIGIIDKLRWFINAGDSKPGS